MLLRVMVACAVLNAALAMHLPVYVAPPFAIGALIVLSLWRADSDAKMDGTNLDSPLQLRAALQMTALFQLVLFAVLIVKSRWGSEALFATAALVGLTDLDALTLSLARSANVPDQLSATAMMLAVGVLSNTSLKLAVAVVVGRGSFRTVTGVALAAIALAIAVTLATD
jgi:uncharacterized membrane protein (DUF4010 family)